MKVTEKNLAKYGMMRDAGFTKDEIRREFGEPRRKKNNNVVASTARPNNKGDKVMSKYPEKTAKADAVEVWRMFDEGKTRKEIAEHFGVSLQTICNRITAGRPKGLEPKAVQNDVKYDDDKGFCASDGISSVTVSDDDDKDDIKEYNGIDKSGISGLYKNTKGARAADALELQGICEEELEGCLQQSPYKDMMELAARGCVIAVAVGFKPCGLEMHTPGGEEHMRITGYDDSGRSYTVEIAVV